MAERFNPLPRGARDLLPAAYQRRRARVDRLLAVTESWGYQPVSTPLIEYADMFGRGLDAPDRDRCVRFTEASTGAVVTLRSDVTPQIARVVAQHTGTDEAHDVVRLSYAADIAAIPRRDDDPIERHQVGVELVGDGSSFADAELVQLCDDALTAVGSQEHRFDLAHTGVLRRVMDTVPEALRPDARRLLARKDRDGLLALLEGVPAAAAVAALVEAFGPAEAALERARAQLQTFGVAEEFERLVAVVAALEPGTRARVDVDLGEVRGHDYYTGLRMRVWAPGSGQPVARGGRYDDLLGRYGPARPATGFAIDLDALEAALRGRGGSIDRPSRRGALVAVLRSANGDEATAPRREAEALARGLRREHGRAWTERVADLAHAIARADERGASTLIIVRPAGAGAGAGVGEVKHWAYGNGTWTKATAVRPGPKSEEE